MFVVTPSIRIPLREIQFTFIRSSGPGGQKVNKTSSRAVLSWNIFNNTSLPEGMKAQILKELSKRISHSGDIIIRSDRFRDRGRNIADCLEKMRELLVKAAEIKKARKATKATGAARANRRESKKRRSETKRLRQRVSLD